MRIRIGLSATALLCAVLNAPMSAQAVTGSGETIDRLVVLYENGDLVTRDLSAPLSVVQANSAAQKLTDTSAVKVAAPDVQIKLINAIQTVVGADPNLWGLDRSDQGVPALDTQFHYSATGSGIPIYVVDTGLNTTHQDFTGRVGTGRNFFEEIADPNYTSAMSSDHYGSNGTVTDCNGHGSHVSGTAAGTQYGEAKQATIIPVRVFGCGDTGSLSYLLNGLQWIIDTHEGISPAVVNMSLGEPSSLLVDSLMGNLVAQLISEHITVVAASGNEDADACGSSPANISAVITVNALATDVVNGNQVDVVPGFSNYGRCTDIYAPGVDISSAWYTTNSATAKLDGTSMASPHIAGVAARILQYNPTFSPAQVSALLIATSSTENLWSGQDAVQDTHHVLHFDDLTAITAPPNVTVSTTAGDGKAVVTWSVPDDTRKATITGYEVIASNSGGTCETSGALTCELTGLTAGTSYTVQVRAKTNGTPVSSAASSEFIPFVATSTPGTPTAVAGKGSAVVTWAEPSEIGTGPITGYTVQTVGGGQTCSTTVEHQCVVAGLSNGTAYRFIVIAHTVYGDTAASSASTAVTPRTIASAPRSVTAKITSKGKAKVSWSAPTSNGGAAISKYQYCLAKCTVALSWKSTGLSKYVLIATKKGATRTIYIRAVNAAGYGPYVKKVYKQTR